MPNTWAVISGIASPDRARQALAAVTHFLLKDHGTLLNYPAFTQPRPDIGYVTRYAPGLRENGGVALSVFGLFPVPGAPDIGEFVG
ncbi:MAG TPA: hypothetical protein PK954_10790, partial [Anaerolineales bacterium]|nr:hypothetical protein [Anaerolineales bacterium]